MPSHRGDFARNSSRRADEAKSFAIGEPRGQVVQDGLVAEHLESVDWVRAYQSFGLLSDEVNDA